MASGGGNISIRPLTADDIQLLKVMRIRAVTDSPRYFVDSKAGAESKSDDDWLGFISGGDREVFGLFDGENHIGIASIFIPPECTAKDKAVLAMGYILPDYRGLGYSDLLYKARLDWAYSHPTVTTLTTSHREGNNASGKAMQRNGFTYSHIEDRTYGDGTSAPSHVYKRELNKI